VCRETGIPAFPGQIHKLQQVIEQAATPLPVAATHCAVDGSSKVAMELKVYSPHPKRAMFGEGD
jgi:hypothetical protein